MKRTLYLQLIWGLSLCAVPLLLPGQAGPTLDETGRAIGERLLRLPPTLEGWTLQFPYGQKGAYYNNRAADHFAAGRYREALLDYTEALRHYGPEEKDRRARIHYRRGLCYYILGEYAVAENDFTQAIYLRPDVSDSWYFRGKLRWLIQGQEAEAAEDLGTVTRLMSGPSVQKAFSLYFLGRPAEAEAEMERLLAAAEYSSDQASEATAAYQMASFAAIRGDGRSASSWLARAFLRGYRHYGWLVQDPNFRPVADDPDFRSLLLKYGLRYRLSALAGPWPMMRGPAPAQSPLARIQPTAPAALFTEAPAFWDENDNQALDAGEFSRLTFFVANRGKGIAQDVRVQVREDNRLRGLSFPETLSLGDLEPGARVQVQIAIQAASDVQEGDADFTFEVREANGFDASPLQIRFSTGTPGLAQLEVADHHFASETGGRMRLSTPVTLRLAVQNTGNAPVRGVVARALPPQDVFIATAAEAEVGNLEAGESKVIDFQFFANSRFQGSEVALAVELREASGCCARLDTFRIALDQVLEVNDRVVISPRPQPARSYAPPQLLSDVDRNLPPARGPQPQALAVVIGVRDYRHPDVPAVAYAHHDAYSIKKYLMGSFGFAEENILLLLNPTQAELNGMFGAAGDFQAKLFNRIQPGVTDLFVYYSGHGAPDVQSGEAYLVPSDCDPSLVKFNGYALRTLYDNLAQLPAKSVTVVMDACFSGASDQGTLLPLASPVRIRTSNALLRKPNAVVLTASGSGEIASWLPAESHSLFTYYFLKALQGAADANRSGSLDVAELRAYLGAEVPAAARRIHNRTQTPEVMGSDPQQVLRY
jgi:hypothetical protein